VPVSKAESSLSSNPIPAAKATSSGQSYCVPYDLSCNNEEYLTPGNVASYIGSIIPHGVEAEARFSVCRDVIRWRQSKTTAETLRENIVVREFAPGNNGILASADPPLHTMNGENDSEMKKALEEWKLQRMAKVHDFLERSQGSFSPCATRMESGTQNKQMTTEGYNSDREEIIKPSWSPFQPDSVAAFQLSEGSPWPPGLSAQDRSGGPTQI